jgi:hypothetical protein
MAKDKKVKLAKQLASLEKQLTKTLEVMQAMSAELNPQPLPPAPVKAEINPQPLPPEQGKRKAQLNPQPLPPKKIKAQSKLNPQPLPPRR